MDPRLEAMYRDLVKRHGKAGADQALQQAEEGLDILDQVLKKKTRQAGTARPPAGPPVGVPPDSIFIRYLDQKDTELWQLPPVHRAAL
jgi:hypothetical protein